MKIAYCGYDFFHSCLVELISMKLDVAQVFTVDCDNRQIFNQYMFEACSNNDIPISCKKITAADIQQLDKEGYDVLITAAYPYKIPDLSASQIKGINIHPALLPIGRGDWPVPWTILKGLKESGISLHKLTPEYDAGDILLQQTCKVSKLDTLDSLSAKLQMMASKLIRACITNIGDVWENAIPQGDQFEYWPKIDNQQRCLDWNMSVEQISRISRAFGKRGCCACFNNQRWIVYSLIAWEETHSYEIGVVVHKTNTEMIVSASNGLVSLMYFEAVNESKGS